jgi:hypothetical protein
MPTRPLSYRSKHGDDFENGAIFDPSTAGRPAVCRPTTPIPTLLLGSACMVSLSG